MVLWISQTRVIEAGAGMQDETPEEEWQENQGKIPAASLSDKEEY